MPQSSTSAGTTATRRSDPIASRVPFFYGWVMLPIVMLVHIATSPGQTYGISVFNPFIREALGLSHSAISGAYMMGTFLASLPMTLVGSLMDRYGPRITLTATVCLFGLSCAFMSQVSGVFTLFIAFLFLRMLGQGAMGLLGMNALAMWFIRRLGFAGGVASLGFTLAMGLVPAAHLMLIDTLGWRKAYLVLGGLVCAVLLPLFALLYRNRPEDIGQLPDGRPAPRVDATSHQGSTLRQTDEADATLPQALRTRAYWILAASTATFSMAITGITFHIVQVFLDVGLTEGDAALMFSAMAVSMAASRFVSGLAVDRWRLNLLLAGSTLGMCLGLLTLVKMDSTWHGQLFGLVTGASQGVMLAVGATVWVRYYGRAHLGKIRGSLATIGVASSSIGPFIMGYAHDLFGGYQEALWLFLALYIPQIITSLWATPPDSSGSRNAGAPEPCRSQA